MMISNATKPSSFHGLNNNNLALYGSTLKPLISTKVICILFKSLLLGIICRSIFKHQDQKMFGLKLTKYE